MWEERCFGNTHIGICRDQPFFGRADIRPCLQQGGRQADRNLRHMGLIFEAEPPGNRTGIAAHQNTDAILGLRDRLFQLSDLRLRLLHQESRL